MIPSKTKKRYYYLGGSLLILICFISICAIIEVKDPEKEYRALFDRHTILIPPSIPSQANFAGEEAPLDLWYVREALDREIIANTFMHSSTILMFKRANRWFPVIGPILKKNGIPDDFKFLAVAESNLGNVVSPAHAEGFWQFTKPTGIKYGLEINEKVDERYNLEKATQAACDYFREAYGIFGSWTLAAASFNRGLDGLKRAIDNQRPGSYYDLYLNDETSRYVFRIMALKEIYNHPVKYGFYLRNRDFYPPIPDRVITIDTAIADLPAFARSLSANYRILRELNPWIRDYSLPNKSGKKYDFRLPGEKAFHYNTLVEELPLEETFFHDTLIINEIH